MVCALTQGVGLADVPPWVPPERGLVSSQAATSWEQALISGNGKYGALVYGQPIHETIVLNHARLFLPLHPPLPPVDTGSHLLDIRRMMAEGQYQRAADYVVELSKTEGFGGKRWTDPFVPAFDLQVSMATNGPVKAYARAVDFSTGVASVKWKDDRGEFQRRLLVSRSDDLVVLSITGPGAGTVDCDLRLAQRPAEGQGGWNAEAMFKTGIQSVAVGAEAGWLTYRSRFRHDWPGSLQGYEGVARVVARGGTARTEGEKIVVRGADEVWVGLRIGLLADFAASQMPVLKKQLAKFKPDFAALLARHAELHGRLFNRCRLDLGGAADRGLTSEELIAKSRVGNLLPALLEKEFDASRYAVLSSSGECFPNLQGIWNGTWSPPWSGDFTLNGNVETAIAADLSANLAECLEPFFHYLEAHLPEYRTNAARLYGCRGIHVPSRASSHGLNNHFDATWPMTFWTAGAGWAARFFYDYYLYSGDRRFLERRALPFMKEAALFYEDFLVEGRDGKWLFSPSYSPENHPQNNPSQAGINATMDIAVATELLRNCIAACEELAVEPEAVERWRAMLARMPDYAINADGAVQEWITPLLEDNYAHRHCSHLYALFYGLPDDLATNALLRKAFQVAAEKRMEIRRQENGGVMAFGLVQLGQVASSLRDAPMSYEVVDWLANNYWAPNLVSTHNPKSLFNVDLCGGLPAVVLQMLVDSRPGWIELLPALPAQWPSGQVQGVRCRGQIEIRSLSWTPQRLSVTLRSEIAQSVELRARPFNWIKSVLLSAGKEITLQTSAP